MANRVFTSAQRAVPFIDRASQLLGVGLIFKILKTLLLSKDVWMQNLLGFLAARAVIFGDLYPFGAAFFIAVLTSLDRRRSVAAAISVTAGVATIWPWHRALVFAAAVGACLLLTRETGERAALRRGMQSRWSMMAACTIVFGVARLAPGWVEGLTMHEIVSTTVHTALIAFLSVLLIPINSLSWTKSGFRLERETLVAFVLLIGVAGLGLHSVKLGWFAPAEVWYRWVTLLAALVGSGAAGAAMGTFLGVLLSSMGFLPVGGMGLYAVSGLFAGLFSRRGKVGVAFGFLLGQMVVSVHASGSTEISIGLVHTASALCLMAATPRRFLRRVALALPGSDAQATLQLARERRLREAINERLRDVGQVFYELAEVFEGPRVKRSGERMGEDDFHQLIDVVWSNQCRGCPGFSKCWETHFYRSYWDMVDLVAIAERKGKAHLSDLPKGLASRCFKDSGLVAAVNQALGSEPTVRRGNVEGIGIVPQQLRGLAELVENVAGQVKVDTGRAEEIEAHLAEELKARRMRVDSVRVTRAGNHPEVEVLFSGACDGYGSCGISLVPIMERILGDRYRAETYCRNAADEPCRVELIPEPPYTLHVEMATIAKGESTVSGDSFSEVELGGGKVGLVLSDGMGAGDRAALESQATVGMLEKMLRAGFDRAFAAHTVNAVLLMRSVDEMFATVDLAVVDTFTGEVEFLKVGSSPTFVKRGREVEIVQSESLPAGILSEIDVYAKGQALREGDVLVMMTDGILDALPHRFDKEEWIARMLRRVESQNPKELVHLLVDRAKQAAGGEVNDDMTVLVARLQQRSSSSFDNLRSGDIPTYARQHAPKSRQKNETAITGAR